MMKNIESKVFDDIKASDTKTGSATVINKNNQGRRRCRQKRKW